MVQNFEGHVNSDASKLPDRWEFDFDPVDDREIPLCFIYEYAREHAKQSKRWRDLTAQLNIRQSDKRSNNSRPSQTVVREIGSIFGRAKSLPWFYDRALVATPWQALDKKLRCDEAENFNRQKSDAQSFTEFISLDIVLERDLPEYAEAGVKDFESWALLDKCFHHEADQREHGFIAVNWNYTDGHLVDAFKKWLADKRGHRKDVESQQGKAKFRQYLKALGAKRVLDAGLTVKQAIICTERILKDKQGNPYPLYDSDRGWSKAKNETVPAILKRLFPSGQ
jgi:hypothetical protein